MAVRPKASVSLERPWLARLPIALIGVLALGLLTGCGGKADPPAPAGSSTPSGQVASAAGATPGVWSAPVQLVQDTTEPFGLAAVSCASQKFCVAVDKRGSAYTFDGTAWSAGKGIAQLDVEMPVSRLISVSCSSEAFCVAMGYSGTVTLDGAKWTTEAGLARRGASVSCPSPSFCAALGNPQEVEPLKVFTPATGWQPQTIPVKPPMLQVSCTTPEFCLAIGYHDTLAWDGTKWTRVAAAPNQNMLLDPRGLSCASKTLCIALTYPDDVDRSTSQAWRWDGSAWQVTEVPADVSANSVSCTAKGWCQMMTTEESGRELAAAFEYTQDSGWRPVGHEMPGETTTESISCVDSDFCAAVGGSSARIWRR